jgi:ATP-binding cassette subfamily B protein
VTGVQTCALPICVDEIGTPEELAKTGGIYAELLTLQEADTALTKRRLKEFEIDV